MVKLPKIMPYLKTVTARGKQYEYFDTGVSVGGKRVYKRLPARSDRAFAQSYAGFLAARTARKNVKAIPTINDLSRAYQLSDKYRRRAASTQDTYLTYLKVVEANFGMARVDRVYPRDINKLVETMQDRPSAANMVLLVLRNMFSLAVKREWITVSPVRELDNLKPKDADYDPWPEDLLRAGLADPEVSLAVALLYYTGQRIGDVCKMRWADIQPDGTIYVLQEKTKKEVWVPMHHELVPILANAARHGETMLHGQKGRKVRIATLRLQLQRWALKRAHEIVPHGLRKNAVNTLLESGCTMGETASITGHSLKLVEHYAKGMNTRKMARSGMAKWSGTEQANRNELENG
jgi:integrase